MDQPYTSDELFHFVGWHSPLDHEKNYSVLLKVLGSGRVSHAPHEGEGTTMVSFHPDGHLANETLIIPTVTCYADIPRECLGTHVMKYGHFGLGFKRDLLIKWGARPVLYIPMFSNEWQHAINGKYLIDDIEAVYRGFRNHCYERVPTAERDKSRPMKSIPTNEIDTLNALRRVLEKDILAFIKPFNSERAAAERENYYMEREWRKYGNLLFDFDKVTRVWVAEGFADRLRYDLPAYEGPIDAVTGAAT